MVLSEGQALERLQISPPASVWGVHPGFLLPGSQPRDWGGRCRTSRRRDTRARWLL